MTIEKEVLASKLAAIDRRRAELELLLKNPDANSYRDQELAHELRYLNGERAEVERQLHAPDAAIADEAHRQRLMTQAALMRARVEPTNNTAEAKAARQAQRKALIDQLEAEEMASYEDAARRCERQGDFRQGRLWREEGWRVRSRLEDSQIP